MESVIATLALTNSELYSELGRVLGINRDSTKWDATTTLADVDRIIRSGRRRFFSANNWKFLKDDLTINIVAPQTTGTITIVAGVVTLTGATWPTAFGDYLLNPDGGGVYTIASYDSTTQITLNDTTVAAAALSTYNLYKVKYDLPAAFGGWEGPIVLENYQGRTLNEARNFPEYVIRVFTNRDQARADMPELYSIRSTPDSETAIATHQLLVYPLPDAVYVISGRYKINAGDTLDLANSALVSDPVFSECYKESVLAAAEVIAFGKPGSHSQRFQELLVEAVRQDNAMAGIRYGRPRKHTAGRSRYYDLVTGTVDMSGQE